MTALPRQIFRILLPLGLSVHFLAPPVHASTFPATSGKSSAWALAQSDPKELMRQAARNESANSYGHRPPMRYRLRKVTAKSDTTKEVVETADGGVARLVEIGGRPLSAQQEEKEIERLLAVLADPSIEAHRRRSERRDAERVGKFTRMLPDAFIYRSAGAAQTTDGAVIRLTFKPNPNFTPPDFGSRILTAIRGEVWIDPQDVRVVRIQGSVFKTVDFGWGILGSVYPGATLLLEQSKTETCGWQLTHLGLHLNGKELIFKSLHIAVEETASDYQPAPRAWNYKEAVRWLLETAAAPPKDTDKS